MKGCTWLLWPLRDIYPTTPCYDLVSLLDVLKLIWRRIALIVNLQWQTSANWGSLPEHINRCGDFVVERSPRTREIGVRSPVGTDLSLLTGSDSYTAKGVSVTGLEITKYNALPRVTVGVVLSRTLTAHLLKVPIIGSSSSAMVTSPTVV